MEMGRARPDQPIKSHGFESRTYQQGDDMKRKVNEIIIHCSASGPKTKISDIKKWHLDRGFFDIGYHYVIENDGAIRIGRNIETMGAHCKGHNAKSVGVCLVGGFDGKVLHEFSEKQAHALKMLIPEIQQIIGHVVPVVGHRTYAKKECPNFDVSEFLKTGKFVYLRG